MSSQSELGTDNTFKDIITDGIVQRVNLARFIVKQQNVYLPFKQILQVCALILVLILGYSFYSYWEQAVLSKHIAKLQLQSAELVEKVGSDPVKRMQELVGNDVVYTTLQIQRLKNSPGFSSYLAAIAAACPSGVWLTSININKHGNSAILLGNAYHSNNIMRFVGNLNRDSIFRDTPFFLAKIEKVKGQGITVNNSNLGEIYSFTLQIQETAR